MAEFPHCDSRVLHAPGVCKFCDDFPNWQQQRVADKVNFTDEYDPDKRFCPSTDFRSPDVINKWGGNVAQGYEKS
jgi:hypothetical protein